jgi:hypothetical protein
MGLGAAKLARGGNVRTMAPAAQRLGIERHRVFAGTDKEFAGSLCHPASISLESPGAALVAARESL